MVLSLYHCNIFSCVFWFSVNSSMSDINIIMLVFLLFVFAFYFFPTLKHFQSFQGTQFWMYLSHMALVKFFFATPWAVSKEWEYQGKIKEGFYSSCPLFLLLFFTDWTTLSCHWPFRSKSSPYHCQHGYYTASLIFDRWLLDFSLFFHLLSLASSNSTLNK